MIRKRIFPFVVHCILRKINNNFITNNRGLKKVMSFCTSFIKYGKETISTVCNPQKDSQIYPLFRRCNIVYLSINKRFNDRRHTDVERECRRSEERFCMDILSYFIGYWCIFALFSRIKECTFVRTIELQNPEKHVFFCGNGLLFSEFSFPALG